MDMLENYIILQLDKDYQHGLLHYQHDELHDTSHRSSGFSSRWIGREGAIGWSLARWDVRHIVMVVTSNQNDSLMKNLL